MMTQHYGSLLKYPARVSFLWYLSAILIGGVLLHQPFCRYESADPISFVDAVFTSTSATCVTGLAVRSTGNEFNFVGQCVILTLVQLGGIGIITVTTFAMVQMGNRASLRQRTVIVESLGVSDRADLRSILHDIITITLVFEVIGATLLTLRFWIGYGMPVASAGWYGVFHAVSAFCNAGFGLSDYNLMKYQKDPLVNFTICALIIIGGIGYPVILDIKRSMQGRHRGRRGLTLHSKVMIVGTMAILAISVVGFLILEEDGALAGLSWSDRAITSFFHAVTCRTAGFNTIDVAKLSDATLFLTILLMVIGAGPCSTAGGFKVSTLSILLLHAWSRFRGATRINVFRRTIPSELAGRATALAMLFGVVIVIVLTVMLVVEQNGLGAENAPRHFLNVLFEVASALGTVGLSTGITPQLSDLGKMVIVVVMFIGRLGPISLFVAVSLPDKRSTLEYYNEEPLLG
jgi:trk system potassium uptake protein